MSTVQIYSTFKQRIYALVLTLLMGALFLMLLFWIKIITPDPPFPESESGGGQELALGIADLGNDNVDFSTMGAVTDVVTASDSKAIDDVLSDPDGVEIYNPKIKTHSKTKASILPKNQKIIVIPETVPIPESRPISEAERILKQSQEAKALRGGGIGSSTAPGQSGSADGNPFAHGSGGTGTGTDGGNGNESGSHSGKGNSGSGNFSFNLKGRSVLVPPKLPSDLKEEGKVVVEITVDAEGNVIEANPNGRGTSTGSAVLKAKAKQAALRTRFNVEGKYQEQHGTLIFIFSFD
jgi:TonB family protein